MDPSASKYCDERSFVSRNNASRQLNDAFVTSRRLPVEFFV